MLFLTFARHHVEFNISRRVEHSDPVPYYITLVINDCKSAVLQNIPFKDLVLDPTIINCVTGTVLLHHQVPRHRLVLWSIQSITSCNSFGIMVWQHKTIPDTVTPTRRSARTRAAQADSATKQTPGQRFRSLLTVCEDYVPVADVVGADSRVDDVIVLPPPTKRTRRKNLDKPNKKDTGIATAAIDVADIPLPPDFSLDDCNVAKWRGSISCCWY